MKKMPQEVTCTVRVFIECHFYPDLDSLSGFKWTGPDPLSNSTRASDIFLHTSALLFPKEMHWIEFRFVRFDGVSDETIGEDLFFLPRFGTCPGKSVSHSYPTCSFRLSLWSHTESLPYSSSLTRSQPPALSAMLSLDPRIFVRDISSIYG
jgi:hypothetical protein